jgi:hypothetical protein
MVAFYVEKINGKEINAKTGETWKINDVPKLWKTKVQAELRG